MPGFLSLRVLKKKKKNLAWTLLLYVTKMSMKLVHIRKFENTSSPMDTFLLRMYIANRRIKPQPNYTTDVAPFTFLVCLATEKLANSDLNFF